MTAIVSECPCHLLFVIKIFSITIRKKYILILLIIIKYVTLSDNLNEIGVLTTKVSNLSGNK